VDTPVKSTRLDAVGIRRQIEAIHQVYKKLTNLPAAADAFAQSDQDNLSAFVSTSYAELTQASVNKIVERMSHHGLRQGDVCLDVGSGYGRVDTHVALATGMAAIGIEAVPERHALAKQYIAACQARKLDLSGVELYDGNVLDNLNLLFVATHVLVFDARFKAETRAAEPVVLSRWIQVAAALLHQGQGQGNQFTR
jgi:cyclopropane fatty-acyl-phospholipid synthase-like methyltransferase